jgi:hypothetical protein
VRYRTALKTGRTVAPQQAAVPQGSFSLPVLAAWIMAVVLVAGTFAAVRSQAQDQVPSEDASITRRVESALAKDPFLRSQEIYVETQDGVVNLSGFVRSLEDIAKAGDLARGVRGVAAVRNGLRVANRPSRA